MMLGLYLSLMVLLFPADGRRQDNTQTVYVKSWKKGEVKIEEQKLAIELTPRNPEYQKTINDSTGNPRYILQIRHQPQRKGGNLYESWIVDLCEFRKPNKKPVYAEDCKLLAEEGRGHGDNLPREDLIGWLYPFERPDCFNFGMCAYPILAKRVIKVDRFYCLIQVISYRISQKNPKVVDSLKVEVELTNRYEPSKAA